MYAHPHYLRANVHVLPRPVTHVAGNTFCGTPVGHKQPSSTILWHVLPLIERRASRRRGLAVRVSQGLPCVGRFSPPPGIGTINNDFQTKDTWHSSSGMFFVGLCRTPASKIKGTHGGLWVFKDTHRLSYGKTVCHAEGVEDTRLNSATTCLGNW